MPISNYFAQHENENEQVLYDDLTVEMVEERGVEMYYIPRILKAEDVIYTESPTSEFHNAYPIPVLITSWQGFQGVGSILTKFGVEIPDQIELSIAFRTFDVEVATLENELNLIRPREGDLLYFTERDACFQIYFVDKREVFYPLGALHSWRVTCELYRFSGEKFETGIPYIDDLAQYSPDLVFWGFHNEDDDFWLNEANNVLVHETYGSTSPEPWTDNEAIQDEANDFIQQANDDPFSWGNI